MAGQEYIKGTLRTIVLKLLSESNKMYGYEITQKVEELTKGQITLTYGALYPILYKLENEGLLETTSEIVDGRARKYYALTSSGKDVAKVKVDELNQFIESLTTLLAPQPKLNSSF